MKHELLSRKELADRLGVDVRTITNWVQDGMPQRTASGRPVYAWPECYAWREKKIREDARAERDAGGDQGRKEQMAELRLRALRAEAESAELELAERRGQLIPVDFMRAEFQRIAQGLRARLLSIPSSWGGRLGGCTNTVERELALQEAVNELLPLCGDVADEEDKDDDDENGVAV